MENTSGLDCPKTAEIVLKQRLNNPQCAAGGMTGKARQRKWATAHKTEQRSQARRQQCERVCSAFTHAALVLLAGKHTTCGLSAGYDRSTAFFRIMVLSALTMPALFNAKAQAEGGLCGGLLCITA